MIPPTHPEWLRSIIGDALEQRKDKRKYHYSKRSLIKHNYLDDKYKAIVWKEVYKKIKNTYYRNQITRHLLELV
jgi:hypothetical protein